MAAIKPRGGERGDQPSPPERLLDLSGEKKGPPISASILFAKHACILLAKEIIAGTSEEGETWPIHNESQQERRLEKKKKKHEIGLPRIKEGSWKKGGPSSS